jgi:hypothetical protein
MLTNWPQLLANYQTAIPLKTFLALLGVALFVTVLFSYVAGISLLGLAWFFVARAFGEQKLPSRTGVPAEHYRDAVLMAAAGTAALLGLSRLMQAASQAWPTLQRSVEATLPTGLDSYSPAAQAIGSAIARGLFLTGAIGLAAGLIGGYVQKRWMQYGLLLTASLALVGDWGSPADFAKQFVLKSIVLGIYWLGVRSVLRFNAPAYFLLAALPPLVSAAATLMQQPNPFLRLNGWVVVGGAAVLLAWPVVAWRRAIHRELPVAASAGSE